MPKLANASPLQFKYGKRSLFITKKGGTIQKEYCILFFFRLKNPENHYGAM
uniref:Uncharacterized protein n=1 Tax=Kuenenia stuttgartiensis TaxID=174633 RepID=Q1PZQ3_KUEST|nr:unknown protein [Candidatus Kuenenia stuttgartiensis]